MEFTCPHCGKTFIQTVRKASTSDKANAARRRNGALGGKPRVAPDELIEDVFLQGQEKGTVWTGESFAKAVQKANGSTYSRSRAFAVLASLRAKFPALPAAKPTPSGSLVRSGYRARDKLPARSKHSHKAKVR